MFYILKKKKYVLFIFQELSYEIKLSNSETQISLLMIPNVEKEGWHYLAVKCRKRKLALSCSKKTLC